MGVSLARGLSIMRHIVNVRGVVDAVINDKRTSIPFCQKTDALTRKSEMNRNGQALTRERRPAKRNLHLASVQVNGRAVLSVLRSLAGEGFRLERMPLRVTAHCVCYCALLRVRGCGCRPNGMELPLSLARGVSIMRCVVNVRGVVDAVINDKRTSIPFCQKNRCCNSQERDKPKGPSVDSREKACKTESPSRQCTDYR